MFKGESSSSNAQMGALADVASEDFGVGKANKKKNKENLVAAEEFICVSLH